MLRDFPLGSFKLSAMRCVPRPFRAVRRVALRTASVLLAALAFGFGGGLGGLGSGTQKVGKPERENPIVCIAERVNARS